jgi:hypothetical protein
MKAYEKGNLNIANMYQLQLNLKNYKSLGKGKFKNNIPNEIEETERRM